MKLLAKCQVVGVANRKFRDHNRGTVHATGYLHGVGWHAGLMI